MENPRVAKIVEQLENTMKEEINPCDGLPESLLLLVSSLNSITNIDLLIVDRGEGYTSDLERFPFLRTGMAYP